jgi:hypothetical protein
MQKNSTNTILMIRPKNFGLNMETANDNGFQNKNSPLTPEEVQNRALAEFDGYVKVLKSAGINVVEMEDSDDPVLRDSIFPNNWFSTHDNHGLIIYPMKAKNRRLEKFGNTLPYLQENYKIEHQLDMAIEEAEEIFLEGTGSIIFDRVNKIAYAGISERTSEHLFHELCKKIEYTPVTFNPVDEHGKAIYHTNVMLSITTDLAIICLESLKNQDEHTEILESFERTHKTIIDVSFEQMRNFCCNVLEVQNADGDKLLTMSTRAYNAFTDAQKTLIEKHCKMIHSDLATIEDIGGGGSRCMMAEIYLHKK